MSRYIDADAMIADMQERYCKPCKEKGEDYNEVRCRACWVDDAMDEVDGFGDDGIDIVRCGECKYWNGDGVFTVNGLGEEEQLCRWWSKFGIIRTAENGFCSYGERGRVDGDIHRALGSDG